MRTLSEALGWIPQQNGKLLDFDGKYGGQCVDLFNFYWRYLGIPVQWFEAAKQAWDENYPETTKHESPQPGDVAVWNGNTGSGFGHVALVMEVHEGGFTSMDENYYNFSLDKGAPCAPVKHNMNNIAGFIRPNFLPEPEPAQQQSTPTAEPRPTGNQYTIKPNDTYWGLEESWGLPHGTLEPMNPLSPARNLQIGQTINIPGGAAPEPPAPRKYTMVKDDNYWNLENHFGWPHGVLLQMNPQFPDPRKVPVGAEINIPQ